MVSASQPVLGIIGLGLMGSALAERALDAGFQVHGFDIDPLRCRELRRLGGQAADSAIAVAAACRRLVFSLMTTEQVETTLQIIGAALRRGSVVIDTSTGDPDRMATLATRLRRRGIHYLDAPIVGNSAEARAGNVLVLAGGDRHAFQRCRKIFKSFARRTYHVGRCGHGARMKLVINLALGLNRAVLAEALGFARATGVPAARALEIMKESAAYSRVMETKGPKMLSGDFSAQARLDQHLKDVTLILATGQRHAANLPLSSLHRKLLATLVRAGHGRLDNSAIIKAFQ